MIESILQNETGIYEWPVIPLNASIGRMNEVIIASHIDKLIRKGVQKLRSLRNFIITIMVSRFPKVPKNNIIL